MQTIVYASLASRAMEPEELESLLSSARAHNETREVTGMLVYSEGTFLQQIEGDDEAVADVFARIESDDRHRDIRVLSRRAIGDRRFPDWSMGFDSADPGSLESRVAGYAAPHGVPLPSNELIIDAEVAEALLGFYALGPGREAV